MRTVKRNPLLSGACALLGGVFLLVGTARADVVTDQAAGLVVFPKLVLNSGAGIDTVIQLSNTTNEPVNVWCFYVNANSHCSNDPTRVCRINADCNAVGAVCIPGWVEIDFRFRLTAWQPIVWRISEGLGVGEFPLDGTIRVGPNGQANTDSRIPGVPEDPFIGELKCIQVGEDDAPTDGNALKGEASIITAASDTLDIRAYNAVGIQAVEGANDGDRTLVLGEEYNGCPNILILDHFFDDAIEPITGARVRTDITFVPCSQNFEVQESALFRTVIQFLVYNEFEQRFSTSTSVQCLREVTLSDIDTQQRGLNDTNPANTGDSRSIFNVNVQGTLTGQTRMRAVDDGSDAHGNGIIAVAEEFHRTANSLASVRASAAFNVHHAGQRQTTDIIQLP